MQGQYLELVESLSEKANEVYVIEKEYQEYLAGCEKYGILTEEQLLLEFKIFGKIKDFVVNIKDAIGVGINDLFSIFKNKTIFKLFSKIKWSFGALSELLKKGVKIYNDFQNAIAEYISNTKVGKWTTAQFEKLDEFLQEHPTLRKVAGPAIASLLVYMWFTMTFTGDLIDDFDLSAVVQALTGNYTMATIFGGAGGMKLLALFALGAGSGLSVSWPIFKGFGKSGQLLFGLVATLAKHAKVRLKTEGSK